LLGYLRDIMALAIGGSPDLMRTANPNGAESLRESGKAWGTMTLLSAMQLLDETIVRMKHSVQPRILLEVALVQICNLQDLQLLSDVVKGLVTGHRPHLSVAPPSQIPPMPPMPMVTKDSAAQPPSSPETTPPSVAPTSSPTVAPEGSMSQEADSKKKEDELISAEAALEIFRSVVGKIEGIVQQAAWMTLEVQPTSSRRWRVLLARDAKFAIDWFRKPESEALIRNALRESMDTAISEELAFEWNLTDREPIPGLKPEDTSTDAEVSQRSVPPGNSNQRIREAMNHPLITKFMDVFDGHVYRVDDSVATAIRPPRFETSLESQKDLPSDL